ncbi:hypothetical protein EGM51_10735 [Verrucomicrobia bacterium S94]|nr:hypothetical protein EGM51_10735 [Verrucomicrobia bacterium S94]
MIKQWAEWKVGQAGARKAMARIKLSTKGTLTCSKCQAPAQHVLFEGGRCAKCFRPKRISESQLPLNTTAAPSEVVVHPETEALKTRFSILMNTLDVDSVSTIAGILQLPVASTYKWYNDELHSLGQHRMNARITNAIDRFERGAVA